MKLFHILAALAIPAVCLGLSSCGNSFEKTGDQLVSIETELAQHLLDCKTADDVSAVVKYIDEATAEIKELTAEAKAEKADLINEYKNLTGRELKELDEREIGEQKVAALLQDGLQHITKISDSNKQTVGEAFLKHAEAGMELGQVLNEIETEAKHFFATFAAAAVLVSCSKDKEDYTDDACALMNEAAELVLNCHTFEDSFEVADKVHAIADELEALEEDEEKHVVEFSEAALDMTVAETKIYEEQLMNKIAAAKDHLNRADVHIKKKDSKINTDYLDYAIQRVKEHMPSTCELEQGPMM